MVFKAGTTETYDLQEQDLDLDGGELPHPGLKVSYFFLLFPTFWGLSYFFLL